MLEKRKSTFYTKIRSEHIIRLSRGLCQLQILQHLHRVHKIMIMRWREHAREHEHDGERRRTQAGALRRWVHAEIYKWSLQREGATENLRLVMFWFGLVSKPVVLVWFQLVLVLKFSNQKPKPSSMVWFGLVLV
jgi:hypothetical protein